MTEQLRQTADNLPVNLNEIPVATRLAIVLPRLESVARGMEVEEANRLRSKPILDAAESYVPSFYLEISNLLIDTHLILGKAGIDPNVINADEVINDILSPYLPKTGDLKTSVKRRVFDSLAKDRLRQLQRKFHPDNTDDVLNSLFSDDLRNEIFNMLSEISPEKLDRKPLVIAHLRTLPKYSLEIIRQALLQGQTLDGIAAKNPGLVGKIEEMVYLYQVFSPLKQYDKSFMEPEAARAEALRIKEGLDRYSKVSAVRAVYSTFAGIVVYAQAKGLDEVSRVHLKTLAERIKALDNYLSLAAQREGEEPSFKETAEISARAGMAEQEIRKLPADIFTLASAFAECEPYSAHPKNSIREFSEALSIAIQKSVLYASGVSKEVDKIIAQKKQAMVVQAAASDAVFVPTWRRRTVEAKLFF